LINTTVFPLLITTPLPLPPPPLSLFVFLFLLPFFPFSQPKNNFKDKRMNK
jgi:hypothetical protein